MKSIQFYLKIFLNIFLRYKIIILISLFSGFIIFFTINTLINKTYLFNTKHIGYVGLYRSNELPEEITSKISFSLVVFDENLVPVPKAALSWETPDNGKSWIFTLKDDLYWHDKTKLISSDLEFNFSDVTYDVIDDRTLSFSLENIFSPFPSIMSKPLFKKGLVGLGDWRIEKINISGGFVHSLIIKNSMTHEKEIYNFYPTIDSAKTAYKLGQIDRIINIIDHNPFGEWKGTKIEEAVNKNQSIVLFYNINNKFLNDKNIRQALTYSINKSYINNRSFSPISPLSWAYNPQVKKYETDIDKAREIISELPDELKINEYTFKIITSSDLLPIAENISKDWENISIKSEILVSPIIPSEFDAFLTIYDIPEDPDQYSLWHSTQNNSNITKYVSPRIDKLLEEGRSVVDINERKKIYFDFQRFLLEDVPAVFLYHPTYYTIIRKRNN